MRDQVGGGRRRLPPCSPVSFFQGGQWSRSFFVKCVAFWDSGSFSHFGRDAGSRSVYLCVNLNMVIDPVSERRWEVEGVWCLRGAAVIGPSSGCRGGPGLARSDFQEKPRGPGFYVETAESYKLATPASFVQILGGPSTSSTRPELVLGSQVCGPGSRRPPVGRGEAPAWGQGLMRRQGETCGQRDTVWSFVQSVLVQREPPGEFASTVPSARRTHLGFLSIDLVSVSSLSVYLLSGLDVLRGRCLEGALGAAF